MRAFMNWIRAAANRAKAWWNSRNNRQNNKQLALVKRPTRVATIRVILYLAVMARVILYWAVMAGRFLVRLWKKFWKRFWTRFWPKFWNVLDSLAGGICRAAMIGLIFYVVAMSFCPELPEKFPAIYGWYTGCAQFVEFAVKVGLKGLYSLFTGQWSEFVHEFWTGRDNLLQQFANWIVGLHL